MLTKFEEIIDKVFEHEAGFVDHPDDPGGATNMGITIHTMRRLSMDLDGDGDVDINDVRSLTREQARDIYYREYWLKSKCDKMPDHLKHIYFDMVVNFGPGGATRVMQEAANARWYYAIKNGSVKALVVDGAIGPNTLSRMEPLELDRVRSYRVLRFARIVQSNPSQAVFWYGWFRRALEV